MQVFEEEKAGIPSVLHVTDREYGKLMFNFEYSLPSWMSFSEQPEVCPINLGPIFTFSSKLISCCYKEYVRNVLPFLTSSLTFAISPQAEQVNSVKDDVMTHKYSPHLEHNPWVSMLPAIPGCNSFLKKYRLCGMQPGIKVFKSKIKSAVASSVQQCRKRNANTNVKSWPLVTLLPL